MHITDSFAAGPAQLMTFSAVCTALSRSRNGLYLLLQHDPNFPRPLKMGEGRAGRVFFVEAEIAAWQRDHLARRP